jgi:olefin beta-lactone synthetase
MSTNILNLFLEQCKLTPDKIAIVDNNASISFIELEHKIIAKANYFKSKRIKAGDSVLVFIPMNIELYVNVMALFYIDATAIFLDEWINMKRLKLCCQIADCTAIIAGWKIKLLRIFIKPLRDIKIFLNANSINHNVISSYIESPESTALITFTTGSTGTPKAAVRTHQFLLEQFNALLPLLNPKEDRIDMPMLPIVLLLNLGIGRTSVIANFKASKPASFNPEIIAAQIIKDNVKSITASPAYLIALANYCAKENINLNLKKIIIGGAAIFPNHAKLLLQNLSNDITCVYGSTEAEPIAHCNAIDLVNNFSVTSKGLYVGNIDENTKVKIIEYTENKIDKNNLPNYILKNENQIGEIIVSGKHVLDTYFKNEAAFKQNKIINQFGVLWHRTGDMGFINENNKLFLLGRCKQSFVENDIAFYPFIIEDLLSKINGVALGTILKIENNVYIFIEKNNDATINENEIIESLNNIGINDFKIIYTKIPRDPRHNSKIDYEKLKVQ